MHSDTSVTGVAGFGLLTEFPDIRRILWSEPRALFFGTIWCYGNPGRLENPFQENLVESGKCDNFTVIDGLCWLNSDRIVAKMFLLQRIVGRDGSVVAVYTSVHLCIVSDGTACWQSCDPLDNRVVLGASEEHALTRSCVIIMSSQAGMLCCI